MKTKKFLSLVLALVMALSLAVPAFATTPVPKGVRYILDASSTTITVTDANPATPTDPSDDTWKISIDSKDVTLTDAALKVGSNGDDATPAQIAAWAADSTVSNGYTGWTVSTDGTDVIFTAAANDADADVVTAVGATAADEVLDDYAGLAAGTTTNVTTTTQVPTISVIIPKTGKAVLNPYKMTVNIAADATSNDQIISATQFVKSTSNVALKVSIKAAATPAAGITMATKSVTDKILDKQVYMFLNTAVMNNQDAAPTTVTFPAFEKTSAVVLPNTGDATLSNVLLGAADTGKTSYLGFRLEGDMTPAPTDAWTGSDTVGVALTFTFLASAGSAE